MILLFVAPPLALAIGAVLCVLQLTVAAVYLLVLLGS